MNIETILYKDYENNLPQEGEFVLGQKKGDSIFVYQAFNHKIADYAVENQKFGGENYNFSRMTWIKPNFLWMMYRSNWAKKANQERILAIEIPLKYFLNLLSQGVYSSFSGSQYKSREEWLLLLKKSKVRLQWDPDHNAHGNKLLRRAIQIGIKGKTLEIFNSEYIKSITDITNFVKEQKINLEKKTGDFKVIKEEVIV